MATGHEGQDDEDEDEEDEEDASWQKIKRFPDLRTWSSIAHSRLLSGFN